MKVIVDSVVRYTVTVDRGLVGKQVYYFHVDRNGTVRSVSFGDVLLQNSDLKVILATIKKMGWKLGGEGEGKVEGYDI